MKRLAQAAAILALLVLVMPAFASCKKHEHTWGEWYTEKTPTCTMAGTEIRRCAECGDTDRRELAMTAHSFGGWDMPLGVPCTTESYRTRVCICGYTEKEIIPARQHTFCDWIITKHPSCTEAGERFRNCICGVKEIGTIPPTHSFVNGICEACGRGMVNVCLPDGTTTVNHSSSDGETVYATVTVKADRYEVEEKDGGRFTVRIFCSGERIYSHYLLPRRCYIGYELLNSDGEVVLSGNTRTAEIGVGESFADIEINLYLTELSPSEDYHLRFVDYKLFSP